MMMIARYLLLLLLVLASALGNEAVIDPIGEVQMNADQHQPVNETLVQELVTASGEAPTQISKAAAREVAQMIAEMKVDKEAQSILNEMRSGVLEMQFEGLKSMSHAQKVFELAETVTGLKEADNMFGASDLDELIREFESQGVFHNDRDQLAIYKTNPQQFIDETKSGYLYSFITFARECGYL